MLAMAKAKYGRPRKKSAERYDSGLPKPEMVGPTAETLARRSERLCHLIARNPQKFAAPLVIDPDAGWHIGRLYLVGLLTVRQKDAADRYRKAIAAYEAVLDAPAKPRALDMNRVVGQVPEDEDVQTRRFKRAKRTYDRMHDALSAHGYDMVRCVTEALREQEVSLDMLRLGLNSLDAVQN